jgi:hypothetical protein
VASGSTAENPPGRGGSEQLHAGMDFIHPGSMPGNHYWINCFGPECHSPTPQMEVAPLQLKRAFTLGIPDLEANPALSGGVVQMGMRFSAG